MKMLHTKALVVKENISVEDGIIDAIVGSTAVIDRMGDIIDQNGWDLSAYKQNSVILWGHNVREERPPIGKALKVWVEEKGKETARLMFKVQFDLKDGFAAEIFRKIKEGFINAVSVGFLPSEWKELDPDNWFGGLKYLKQQLLELSFVPVPANPEALVSLRSFAEKDKRFTPTEEKSLFPVLTKEGLAEILHKDLNKSEVVKPYENEHACRLKNPDDFEDNSFRSMNRSHEGKEYRVIIGKLKGQDSMTDQAFRYNKETWKEDEAKAHCTDHKGTFEPAKKAEAKKEEEKKDVPTDVKDVKVEKGDNELRKKLVTIGLHLTQMAALHKKMDDDVGKIDDTDTGKEMKALMEGDVKKMNTHAQNISSTCDDMMSMMDMDKAKAEDLNKKGITVDSIQKIKTVVESIMKQGRVLSAKNEEKVRSAVKLLDEVLSELASEEPDTGVGPDPNAQAKKDLDKKELAVETKGVISYKDLGKLPESESWDGPGEIAKATIEDLKIMCAWFDNEKADNKGSYKLVHHTAEGHKAVWRGVAAAMATLLGAKGGISIPDSDRKGVYNHLKSHYKEFDKEAPDYKMIENQVLGHLEEELQAIVLDREDKHVVKLVKKVIDNNKKDNNTVIEALKVLNLALLKVSSTKGGE